MNSALMVLKATNEQMSFQVGVDAGESIIYFTSTVQVQKKIKKQGNNVRENTPKQKQQSYKNIWKKEDK